MKIAVLPGDGIGQEVTREALRLLELLELPGLEVEHGEVGATAYRNQGHPLPEATLELARSSDAILFGAVGDPSCDNLERHLRPEQAILGLRAALGLFANLRPATAFPGLEHMSGLKPEIAREIDVLIVRELNGDVYFGDKGTRVREDGQREGWDMMSYAESEVRRIAHTAFRAAQTRKNRLTSVDKANVLETSQLWRDVMIEVSAEYPDVELDHMYVDNAAMQLVKAPANFDTIVTGNLFGDILSDQASMCVGSIGLLPSAALGERQTDYGTFGLYEPIHGSAPDIAGKNLANPMATMLSLAMLLRHSLGREADAERIERAVAEVLADGVRGGDLGGSATTTEIGDAVVTKMVSIS
ncbi:3-isopropylmalate dehydrogenase [Altererythrobacter epoxidivorans]|uniref:3-isopropylmalate dehydrogenase n=1 Tax=Altererythrobacter epoxidivorans TaxID=361183 RepID=A0A0M3TAK3_9SPHN|nr:3-isopropylmalate dehydrogenase [Altererythrobacter epoxidivorans]ALE16876.1 3-isopropylmalate dehydrogenase [Altererythrobacter epoxidivorans]